MGVNLALQITQTSLKATLIKCRKASLRYSELSIRQNRRYALYYITHSNIVDKVVREEKKKEMQSFITLSTLLCAFVLQYMHASMTSGIEGTRYVEN